MRTNTTWLRSLITAGLVLLSYIGVVPAWTAETLAPLPLQLPKASLRGTPPDLPTGPHIEPHTEKPPAPFLAPMGVTNLAANRKVTASIKPFTGDLSQITDGKKEPDDEEVVEMRRGKQWVQVDLEAPATLRAVVVWHDHRLIQAFRDVIVQVSDDPDFTQEVKTIFNNDVDNSSGFGIGTDREYFETRYGRVFDAKGVKARYVRAYTNGSSLSALNACQEIEVYGVPAL